MDRRHRTLARRLETVRKAGLPEGLEALWPAIQESSEGRPHPHFLPAALCSLPPQESGDRESTPLQPPGLGSIVCPKTSSQASFFLALSSCFNKDILNK